MGIEMEYCISPEIPTGGRQRLTTALSLRAIVDLYNCSLTLPHDGILQRFLAVDIYEIDVQTRSALE
jgi:hypothetical protein